MSHRLQVFVASKGPLDELARELESLLDVELKLQSNDAKLIYLGNTPDVIFDLIEHELESNEHFAFEEYRYQISVAARHPMDPIARERSLYQFGQIVFNKLRDVKQYRLMLIDDLEVKLDEYDPR